MRKSLFLFIVFFTYCSLIAGPKIHSAQPTYKFATVIQGEVVQHEFIIENTGDEVLQIKRVQSSCGCTAAKPENDEIQPGESTKIKVSFNTTGRVGEQKKYIAVASNDPDNTIYRLTIEGTVQEPPILAVLEAEHNFGAISQDQVVEHTFVFSNAGTSDLEILDIRSSCGCTAATVGNKIIKPGERGKIKVEFNSGKRKGNVTKVVTIRTNDPENSFFSFKIHADVQTNEG